LAELGLTRVPTYINNGRGAGAKPGAVNRELCALSAALNSCRTELDWDVTNPVVGRQLREPEDR